MSDNNSWLDLVKTRGNRKRLVLITLVSFFSQCSGNGLVSYYLHSILESVGVTSAYNQSLINGGLQIWTFLVAVGFAFAVDKVGRRKLFLIAAVGMLISFTIWTAYVVLDFILRSHTVKLTRYQMLCGIRQDWKLECRECRHCHDIPFLWCRWFCLAGFNHRVLC